MFLNPWYLQQGAQPPPASADSPNTSSGTGSGGSPAPERGGTMPMMVERMEEGGLSSHSPSPAPSLISAGSSTSCPPHPSPATAAHVAALQVGNWLSKKIDNNRSIQFSNWSSSKNSIISIILKHNIFAGGPQAGLDCACDTGGTPLLLQVSL